MTGEVAHALERCRHPQRTDDGAQVCGHRSLQSEHLGGLLIEGELHIVDDGVGLDDLLGQLEIIRMQRLIGQADGVEDLGGHADQLGGQIVQFVSEDFAHELRFPNS